MMMMMMTTRSASDMVWSRSRLASFDCENCFLSPCRINRLWELLPIPRSDRPIVRITHYPWLASSDYENCSLSLGSIVQLQELLTTSVASFLLWELLSTPGSHRPIVRIAHYPSVASSHGEICSLSLGQATYKLIFSVINCVSSRFLELALEEKTQNHWTGHPGSLSCGLLYMNAWMSSPSGVQRLVVN